MLSNVWRSRTGVAMAIGMGLTAIVPVLASAPVSATPSHSSPEAYRIAQFFPGRSIRIPEGTQIPVIYDEAERIILTPEESAEVTLVVDQDLYSSSGTLVIPRGSEIDGELLPVNGGTQFQSDRIVLPNGREYDIDARSMVITETQTITEETDPDFLKGAAIGAAAAAVISEIFGDIDFIEVLAGAGLGALAALLIGGNEEEVEVVVVEPETDLDLTLYEDFELQ